jgi:hypothetical protein
MRFTALLLLVLTACQYGDGAAFSREREKERQRRIKSMKAATAEQARGRNIGAEELAGFVSGKTHVFEYGSDPLGRRGRYVEYHYFRPDGRYVFLNTSTQNDPEGKPEDRWRVDGSRLCIVNTWFTSDENCYEVALLPNGRVQYYIHDPGDQTHGLLTKVTNAVQSSAPVPAGQPLR